MHIHIESRQEDVKVDIDAAVKAVKALLAKENIFSHGFNLYFVSTQEICQLHEEFFDDPETTDCISFPIDSKEAEGNDLILGEVFVCPQTAIDYASKMGLNPYDELLLYIVHGFLHCLGFDDIDPKDVKVMRQKETEALDFLKKEGISLNFHAKTIL